jgi:hypothetical protein
VVAARIDDGDVHRTAERLGFRFSAFDDVPGGFQIDGKHLNAAFRKRGD